MAQRDWHIATLGRQQYPSPIQALNYIRDSDHPHFHEDIQAVPIETLQRAGPREHLYFHGPHVTAGIVTCGGLCPALNDVIRALVNTLHYKYRVQRIIGFKYGYAGLNPQSSVRVTV
jgi:6-phosphofructokinase 1